MATANADRDDTLVDEKGMCCVSGGGDQPTTDRSTYCSQVIVNVVVDALCCAVE